MSTKIPIFENFHRAVLRFQEVMKLRKDDVVRDSAIKRFELCFDLAWKSVQTQARNEGLDCQSPRSCLKTGVQLGLIMHDDSWLKMLEDRNLAVHTYKEKYADEIYGKLSHYAVLLAELALRLNI